MDWWSIQFDCWEKDGMMTWCNANDAKKKATNQTNHTMKLGNHGSHLKLRSWGVTQYENPGSAIDYWLEMCLSHVYIVLEPVGSACLTFDDDMYYMSYVFWWPKVVRSPGWDHGHDEESQNGREVKVDILEGYIWTPEWFQSGSCIFQSTEWLPEPPPGEVMGLIGP